MRPDEPAPAYWRDVKSWSPPLPLHIAMMGKAWSPPLKGFVQIGHLNTLAIPTADTLEAGLDRIVSRALQHSDHVLLTEHPDENEQVLVLNQGEAIQGTLTLRDGEFPSIGWAATAGAVNGQVSLLPFRGYDDRGAMAGLLAGSRDSGETPSFHGIRNLTAKLFHNTPSQRTRPGNQVRYEVSQPVALDPLAMGKLPYLPGMATLDLPPEGWVAAGMAGSRGTALLLSPEASAKLLVLRQPEPARLEEVVGWDRLQPEAA